MQQERDYMGLQASARGKAFAAGVAGIAVLLVVTGCAAPETTRYCLYNVEHIHRGAASPVVMGTAAAQVATGQPVRMGTEAGMPQVATFADQSAPMTRGSQTMQGAFTRSSDVDAAAAVQALRNVSKAATDQSAPQGVEKGTATGEKTNTPTVDDKDTVAPTVSVPVTPGG